jgi:hypothetical protein
MASVCAVGLLQIEQTLGGIGAVAAISIAGLLCLALARASGQIDNRFAEWGWVNGFFIAYFWSTSRDFRGGALLITDVVISWI